MGGGVSDDRRKAAARMVQHPERTTAARHGGRDKGKGARLRTVGGGYRGRKREAGAGEEGRHDEAKSFGVAEWWGCSSSRARIYIAAIYSIFIYIIIYISII